MLRACINYAKHRGCFNDAQFSTDQAFDLCAKSTHFKKAKHKNKNINSSNKHKSSIYFIFFILLISTLDFYQQTLNQQLSALNLLDQFTTKKVVEFMLY